MSAQTGARCLELEPVADAGMRPRLASAAKVPHNGLTVRLFVSISCRNMQNVA